MAAKLRALCGTDLSFLSTGFNTNKYSTTRPHTNWSSTRNIQKKIFQFLGLTMDDSVSDNQPNGGVKRPASPIDGNDAKKVSLDVIVSDNTTIDEDSKPFKERQKFRNFVLLMSYSGRGYLGMQRNRNMKTIEEALLLALRDAGFISQEGYDTPKVTHFQRAARTDKGVSAARQIVNIRIPLHDDIPTELNSRLPPQIRIQSAKQVTKRFNSKSFCDARTYSYTLPTFVFAPVESIVTEDYRLPSETRDHVNQILNKYIGTHNFHNFTARRKPLDPSAQRYIMVMDCGVPFMRDGLELAIIQVKGQSFMLHQIRKMIGLAIAIARGMAALDVIEKAWTPVRIDIPIAPGLGLVLEEVHYEKYNIRYGKDGIHQTLTWEEQDDLVAKFKEEFILNSIVQTEKEEKSMFNWLATLPQHSFDIRPENSGGDSTALGCAFRTIGRLNAKNGEEKESEESEDEDKETVKI